MQRTEMNERAQEAHDQVMSKGHSAVDPSALVPTAHTGPPTGR